MQETLWLESKEKGNKNKCIRHTSRNFFHGYIKIQMAAMDSPVSNYVFGFWLKWYLIEETSVGKKKYADYQSGTLLLKIETLSSTDF